ncbi:outer membrane protein OmpU [Rhodovulum sp. ES.010]|uniref:porin n=1 Tax=Rhodovulum sp. ES.010 TaxID=1882821 RepID=UPI00092A7BA0|nr:porin [Rhodovulum sp. ES.010]SIO48200.1 outer membrane protein OmpU [Rhodovulum sp. ES.010]
MKKVLFATTALVASAGVAAADITFSGSAEMGIIGGGDDAPVGPFIGENVDAASGATQFNSDLTLSVGMSGETDAGLSFGVNFDISKDNPDSNGNLGVDNEAAFVSGAFGTLTLGEIDGAMDNRLTENMGNPGTIGDDETIHVGYMGTYGDGAYDNQILRYDYEFGDFGLSLSTEIDDAKSGADAGYAIAVSYSTMVTGVDLGFGLGYQTLEVDAGGYSPGNLGSYLAAPYAAAGDDLDIVGITATADFQNGFVAGLEYSDWDFQTANDADHWAISMGYEIQAWSFHANYGIFDVNNVGDIDGYGLAVAYDLGGGASLHLGYGDGDGPAGVIANDIETWSFGVAMSF